jgi:hypothetical protein
VHHQKLGVLLLSMLLSSCAPEPAPGSVPLSGLSVAEALLPRDTIELEEVGGDTIADIGTFEALEDGRFLVSDRLLPRVRLYDASGSFLRAHGRFGEGPFEYLRVLDASVDRTGRVWVEALRARGTAILTSELMADTLIPFPGEAAGAFGVMRWGERMVQLGVLAGGWRVFVRDTSGGVVWSVPSAPTKIQEQPYWGSINQDHMAVVGDRLVTANSLLYPITVFGPDGDTIRQFGTPPPFYRRVPELEAGALASTASQGGPARNLLAEWLESFTIISGIHVVADRWLVVVHGRVATDPPGPPFVRTDEVIDVYDFESGEKVMEDISLPENARVLAGGAELHVLVQQPPDPWGIARYRIRTR